MGTNALGACGEQGSDKMGAQTGGYGSGSGIDNAGCFSGSALELADGRHLLMYTGVRKVIEEDGSRRDHQTQCMAFGDGTDYEKYENNPVITADNVPEGGSRIDFRDPKIWQEEDGTFYAVASNANAEGNSSNSFV